MLPHDPEAWPVPPNVSVFAEEVKAPRLAMPSMDKLPFIVLAAPNVVAPALMYKLLKDVNTVVGMLLVAVSSTVPVPGVHTGSEAVPGPPGFTSASDPVSRVPPAVMIIFVPLLWLRTIVTEPAISVEPLVKVTIPRRLALPVAPTETAPETVSCGLAPEKVISAVPLPEPITSDAQVKVPLTVTTSGFSMITGSIAAGTFPIRKFALVLLLAALAVRVSEVLLVMDNIVPMRSPLVLYNKSPTANSVVNDVVMPVTNAEPVDVVILPVRFGDIQVLLVPQLPVCRDVIVVCACAAVTASRKNNIKPNPYRCFINKRGLKVKKDCGLQVAGLHTITESRRFLFISF